jgi:CarboxypepD_reg-like domain
MKKPFSLSIPTPCHERWSEFTPTQKGAFCGSCQKEVIDFTQWNEDQIKDYFIHSTANTCGRFRAKQLTIYQELPNPARSWIMASVLMFIVLAVNKPAQAQKKGEVMVQEQLDRKATTPIKSSSSIHQVIIRGIVRSSDDSLGISGVNVNRKGSGGTVTDADGRFELTIHAPKPSETLSFSFIGFITKEQTTPINSPIVEMNASLSCNLKALNEKIVMGGICATPRYSPRRLWQKIKGIFRK